MAIAGVALAVGSFAWFAASLFVPFAHEGTPVEYLLVGAPWWVFVASTLAAAAVLWLVVSRLAVTPRALAPLGCLGLAPLASLEELQPARSEPRLEIGDEREGLLGEYRGCARALGIRGAAAGRRLTCRSDPR